VYGGMWHFRRAGKQAGLTVCGIVIDMSGKGYAVWEGEQLAEEMWGRLCAGCRGPLVGLAVKNAVLQLRLFEQGDLGSGHLPTDRGLETRTKSNGEVRDDNVGRSLA